MGLRSCKRQLKKTSRLNVPASISKQVSEKDLGKSSEDRIDSDIATYLNSFLSDFSKIPPLENIDLTTQEGANSALNTISQAQENIERHLKTARALQTLLELEKKKEQ